MLWVLIFSLIALAGLIGMVMYGVWLWHKVSDLWSELAMLSRRGEEFAELVGQIEFDRLGS